MTTLAEFALKISAQVNKGTTLDSLIPDAIRQAGREVESNYSLKYMETLTSSTISAGVSFLTAPEFMKSIIFIRYTNSDGEYCYLPQVDPMQLSSLDSGNPTGFWLEGRTKIQFDAAPTEDLDVEIFYNKNSDWTAGTIFWLLDNAELLMISTTMILLAPAAREPDWKVLYEDNRKRGERTLFLADHELRQGARDEVMIYTNR